MRHWLRLHWLSLTATLHYIVRAPLTAGLNILVISLALCLPLGLFVILSSGKALINQLPLEPQLTIFMHIDTTPQELSALNKIIEKHPNVETVRFISKEEGLQALAERSGMTDILGGLSENPLPHAFTLTLKDASLEKLTQLQKSISEENGVETVVMDSAWAKQLIALLAVGDILLKILVVVLSAGLILITGNSIRMQILTRLEEIEISKFIGATNAFIRRPFVYFAILQGIAGGLLACTLTWVALYYINPSLRALSALYNTSFVLIGPSPITILCVCLLTAALCLIGALLSVWRHLYRFV